MINSEFNGTFTVLNSINNSLTTCCANLTNDFNGVFTLLNTDFNGTFTALAAGFNATFTILAHLVCSSTTSGSSGFTSGFGDAIVSDRTDQVSDLFEYGVPTYDITTSVFSSGLVQSFTSMAIVSSGTGATAFAQLQSKKYLKYMAGHDGYAFFSAMWPAGSSANSTQWIGVFDANDGAAVGFNGTTFSILFRQNAVDTIIPQSSFNMDKLNGTGASGFTINTADLNVFRIDYGWTGGTQITFQILNTNGSWITFHQINNTNVNPNPSFGNPILPMTAQVKSTGSTTNVTIATAGWNAGIVAEPSVAQSRFFTAGQLTRTAIADNGTETFVVAFQNKSTYQTKPNKVIVRISFVSAGVGVTGGTVTLFRLLRNASITGTSFTDVDTVNSVMQISTAGTLTTSGGLAASGTNMFTFMNANSVPYNTFVPEQDLLLYLYPGETLTITGINIQGGGQLVIGILAWEERF